MHARLKRLVRQLDLDEFNAEYQNKAMLTRWSVDRSDAAGFMSENRDRADAGAQSQPATLNVLSQGGEIKFLVALTVSLSMDDEPASVAAEPVPRTKWEV